MLNSFLRVTKQVDSIDYNITEIELENPVSTGIRWGCLGPGMVPLFEEQQVRIENKYKTNEWYALDEDERAMIIAVHRIDIASRNLQTEAEIRQAKIDARKNARR